MTKIGILVGSLRRESFNRKVAEKFDSYLPESFQTEFVDIGNLEIFNQDYDEDGTTPESWKTFRKKIKDMDAYLFVTPEYNRSMPPVLKNALDIASRPYGSNCWAGKPAGIVSVSTGAIGGFGANHHLRQSLTFLDVYPMQQPEAYLSNIEDCIGADGNITDNTGEFLKSVAEAYVDWVGKFVK